MSKKCVLRDWVMELHLRCQGVLVSSVRGCDTIPKEHPLKDLVRVYRSIVLNAAVTKPSSFIEHVELDEAKQRMEKVLDDVDALPVHYIMHLTHAAQIIGYKHPRDKVRKLWRWFYESMCHGFHLTPETEQRMALRLEAKTEDEFIQEGRRNPYEYP